MLVILFLALQLTEVPGQFSPRFVVRDGDDVTLPCENNGRNYQDTCDKTTWLFNNLRDETIIVSAKTHVYKNPERLKVTKNCSLAIKGVSNKDVGFYTCRTKHSMKQHDAAAYLFLITMSEKKEGEDVWLSCIVSTNEMCKHTVDWMYEGKTVEDTMITRKSRCSVTMVIPDSFPKKNSKYREQLSCKVKDDQTKREQLFTLRPLSVGEDVNTTTNLEGRRASVTLPAVRNTSATPLNLWLYIVVTVGLVALIVTVIVIMLWIKREDEKSTRSPDVELNTNCAADLSTLETRAKVADPDNDMTYSTIHHTKTANGKTGVKDGEEEGDSVTYSSVKVHSADPGSLDATIRNLNE
ncbi:PREDICTED: uncharacterized protein LOC107103598 [Cyprinodon variegatus]|uniref:uncharacterized protein LOC107103598 n=1 Tax=Cyprinodon variegatus TaxID=28743 RepID=UPI000742BB97|nr:PREDICTED: uncharacterized protein LOC107103598 [Cyprinodon variegatus]